MASSSLPKEFETAGLLFVSPNLESLPTTFESTLSDILPRIHTRLVVIIQSHDLESESFKNWHRVNRLLTTLYTTAAKVTHTLGRPLFDVDILLREDLHGFELAPELKCETLFKWKDGKIFEHTASHRVRKVGKTLPADDLFGKALALQPVVAMGGTFDHLHMGHKILLSMAALLASRKLIIGITDDSLLVNKKHREVLESLDERIKKTRTFLELFKPGIEYDLVPITDVYGPTAWDPDVQALVVSKETLSGAASIAKLRDERGLPPLEQYVIDVIAPDGSNLDSEDGSISLKDMKISSTSIRQYILERRSKKQPDSDSSTSEKM